MFKVRRRTLTETTPCAALGLAAPPAKTSLMRDASDAMSALVVDKACQSTHISVVNGTITNPGRTQLKLTGLGIETIVSYPSASRLDLSSNHVSPFAFANDARLAELSLAKNEIDSLEGFSFPVQLRSLDLSRNHLESLAGLELPESMRSLNVSGCRIASLRGLRIPWELELLDLSGNPLREIEIRAADVEVLQALRSTLPFLPNQQCTSPNATLTAVNNTASVCVIPDAVFDAMYNHSSNETASPAPTQPPATSPNQRQIITIVLAVGITMLLVILFIGYWAFRGKYDYTVSTRRGQRRRRTTVEEAKSSGGFVVSSDTGERPLGFPMEYFEADDVRFDAELEQFRIPKDEIRKKKVIGRGGFGVVYLAKHRGMVVALKQLQRDRMRYRTIEHFMKEIRLLANLNHPHIVGFLGLSWSTLHDLAVVLEYLPRGDLYSFLKQQRRKAAKSSTPASEFQWFSSAPGSKSGVPSKSAIAMDVADALAYLHGQQTPIIHRDLKSKNVLLTNDMRAKLTDFGISRMQTIEETMTREVGTIAWIAPEVLKGGRYSEKADIYSFGVLLTELDTCHSPYTTGFGPDAPKRTNTWIASMVSAGALQPNLLESCPMRVRELTLRCLSFDAECRPSAIEILTLLQSMCLQRTS